MPDIPGYVTSIQQKRGRIMITFEKATEEDAQALTDVQIRTFDDDSRRFFGEESGGPPGYDSVDRQIEDIRSGHYYKMLDGERIIGGMNIFEMSDTHCYLGLIYIDPDYQDRGIGTQAIRFAEATFPAAKKWTTNTPAQATRNHHFYEKLGYVKVREELIEEDGESGTLFFYEKRLSG
jgi:ribosomal protein S18 acetylase RimI-like enzyme